MPFCLEPARVKRRTHRQISIIQTDSIHASASTAPDGELDALKHSIARLGLLSPILVRARGNGYELVAGARRLAACRALGMEELGAVYSCSACFCVGLFMVSVLLPVIYKFVTV